MCDRCDQPCGSINLAIVLSVPLPRRDEYEHIDSTGLPLMPELVQVAVSMHRLTSAIIMRRGLKTGKHTLHELMMRPTGTDIKMRQ